MSLVEYIAKFQQPGSMTVPGNYFFHPKPNINNPGDEYEKGANEPAEKMKSMSIQSGLHNNLFFNTSPVSMSPVQRKCDHCEEEKKMQRKEMNDETKVDPSLESYLGNLTNSGKPLPNEVRSFYEPRFGYDFSQVRLHTDAIAAKSAQSVNALAYTSGNNIVFNSGQYSLQTDSGKRLLGHELTHVIQQRSGSLQGPGPMNTLQRQSPEKLTEPSEADRKLYEEERKEFEKRQTEHFGQVGEIMTGQILKNAGFKKDQKLVTPDDAVKLITFWGLSMAKITSEMNSIGSSLTTRVTGSQTNASIAQQQKVHFDALTPKGQKAYEKAIQLVKDEAFWKDYFLQNEIYIYPDLGGSNRFSGYNQAVNDPNDPTGTRKVIIVHVNKIHLENEFPEITASTIVHELSHVVYEPNVLQMALSSLSISVVDLLLEHPDIIAERGKAADPAAVKDQQRSKLKQVLYETLAYAEEEIFVHLQQLTHQPDVTMKTAEGEESLRGAQVLQREVLRYIQRLKKIGLDPRTENGVLDQIGRRVGLFYDRRIAAWPVKSKQRQIMDANKNMALLLLELARKGEIL